MPNTNDPTQPLIDLRDGDPRPLELLANITGLIAGVAEMIDEKTTPSQQADYAVLWHRAAGVLIALADGHDAMGWTLEQSVNELRRELDN